MVVRKRIMSLFIAAIVLFAMIQTAPVTANAADGDITWQDMGEIKLDTAVEVEPERLDSYSFSAPETGYYTLTAIITRQGTSSDFKPWMRIVDENNWLVSEDGTDFSSKDFTYFCIKGGSYHFLFQNTDEEGQYKATLSKTTGFSEFTSDSISLDLPSPSPDGTLIELPQKKVPQSGIAYKFEYKPIKIVIPEKACYYFSVKWYDMQRQIRTVILNADGEVIRADGPSTMTDPIEIHGQIEPGTYYLIPDSLLESEAGSVKLIGETYDPLTSDYCLDGELHNYKDIIVKATFTKDGSFKTVCPACGRVYIPEEKIWKINYAGLDETKFIYTGKAITPEVNIQAGGTALPPSDYSVEYKNNIRTGTASAIVTLKGDWYSGTKTLPFTIKYANTLKASAKSKTNTVKYSTLKKKAQTITAKKAYKITGAKGTLAYKRVKTDSKKITVNTKTGKITIKKGLKKGTYSVTVKITAKGNNNYYSASKNVTLKIKVK